MEGTEHQRVFAAECQRSIEDPSFAPTLAAFDALLQQALASHSNYAVTSKEFARHIAAVCADDLEKLDKLCAGDLLLAFAAVRADRNAVADLEVLLRRASSNALGRFRLTPAQFEEVLQRTRIKLTVGNGAKLLAYAGRGVLEVWLRVAVVRMACNFLAEPGQRSREQDEVDTLIAATVDQDAEVEFLARRYATVVREAIAKSIAELEERERAVLRFFMVEELTIDQIADIYGTHRATAARWVSRARNKLATTVREEFQRRVATTDSDFFSVVRGLPSYLDFSVERLLAEPTSAPASR